MYPLKHGAFGGQEAGDRAGPRLKDGASDAVERCEKEGQKTEEARPILEAQQLVRKLCPEVLVRMQLEEFVRSSENTVFVVGAHLLAHDH